MGMKYSVIVMALALAGCGTVQTTRLGHRYEPDTAITGVSYALPMLQYRIAITHTLSSCGTPGDIRTGKEATSLSFDTKVVPVASYVPGERFNVDYRKLSGLFRTSAFSIEYYPNGTIKSLGASADDKTAEAVASAAKLAGGVIALTSGLPRASVDINAKDSAGDNKLKIQQLFDEGTAPAAQQIYDCSDKARQLLSDLDAAKTDLKAASKALEDANNLVQMLSQRFALKVTRRGDADRWDAAVSAQLQARRTLEAKQKALEEAKKPLSASYDLTWPKDRLPESGEQLFAASFAKNGKLAKPWATLIDVKPMVKPDLGTFDTSPECSVRQGNTPVGCLSAHMDLLLDFDSAWPELPLKTAAMVDDERAARRQQPLFTDAAWVDVVPTTGKSLPGILYREPARGGLVICLKNKAVNGHCDGELLVKPEMVNFPQAGQLRFIPFSVLPFQGKDQSISFTEEGYPSKIALKSTKAAGAEALGAAAGGVTTIADALEKREEERRSDAKAQRDEAVAELTAEITLLEKQAKRAELLAPPSQPSEASLRLAEINADIQMKRALLLQLLLAQGIQSGTIDPAVLFGGGS
jgi:hypothetical protein